MSNEEEDDVVICQSCGVEYPAQTFTCEETGEVLCKDCFFDKYPDSQVVH